MESEETAIAIARGGPIFVPNLIGPLTSIRDFESALLLEIQDLKDALFFNSSSSIILGDDDDDVDLSVDDIKPFADEDLVEMALNHDTSTTLIDADRTNCLHPCVERPSDPREANDSSKNDAQLESSGRTENPSTAVESSNKENCCSGTSHNNKSRKRPRATSRRVARQKKGKKDKKFALDEQCLLRVSEMLKTKEKQDQDKAASRLHSLNCNISKNVIPSSEKTESTKYLKSTNFKKQLKHQNVQGHVALQHPEFVLSVEVYHNIRNWIKTQEFLVLGTQTLTELRDKISCMSDQVMAKEGHYDPSGYFLMEDVFYNDTRDPSSIDYSEPIFGWLKTSKSVALRKWECIIGGELRKKQKAIVGQLPASSLPRFRRFDMQKVRFCDLRFRLGAGYLYCHQGDCRHTIVIRDMRLIHPDDVQNRAAYPFVTFQLKPRVEKCHVCRIFRAKKVTVDDKWAPHNPCYFCDDCYFQLHYDNVSKSLLYSDFWSYDYEYLDVLPD